MLHRVVFIVLCFCFANVKAQDLDWVRPVSNDSFSSIAIRLNPEGEVVALVSSYYFKRNDSIDYSRTNVSLEKYNTAGETIWSIPISSPVSFRINGFDIDSLGSIYMTGYFDKKLQIGDAYFYADSFASFVTKLDNRNEISWFRKAYGIYYEGLNVTQNRKVIIQSYSRNRKVGIERTKDSADLANYEMEYLRNCGFTAYTAGDGNLLWSNYYGWDGEESYTYKMQTKVTINGIYVLGQWNGKIDIETGPGKTILETDTQKLSLWSNIYFSKYGNDGELLWCRILERDSSSYYGELENVSMDADNEGNIFLSGGFYGKVDFDFTEKEHSIKVKIQEHGFEDDYFFARYDDDLNLKWIYTTKANFSSNGFERRLRVKITGKSVYLYGIYKPGINIDFKNADYKLLGDLNHFFAEYDMDGNLLTARNLGIVDDEYFDEPMFWQFEVDKNKNIYLNGVDYSYWSIIKKFDFDPSQDSVFLPDSINKRTAFLARYQTCKKPIQIIPQYTTTNCQERMTTLYALNDHYPVRWYNENGKLLHEGITYTLPQINSSTSITAEDGCGYRDEIVIDRQNRWANIQKVFPNPAKDKLTINLEGIADDELNYQLINTLGQVILTGKLEISDGFQNITLPINVLREGMYFLVLHNQCIKQTEKIFIVK